MFFPTGVSKTFRETTIFFVHIDNTSWYDILYNILQVGALTLFYCDVIAVWFCNAVLIEGWDWIEDY